MLQPARGATPAELKAAYDRVQRDLARERGRLQPAARATPAELKAAYERAKHDLERERERIAAVAAVTLYNRTLANYMALRRKIKQRAAKKGTAGQWHHALAMKDLGAQRQLYGTLLRMRPQGRKPPPAPLERPIST